MRRCCSRKGGTVRRLLILSSVLFGLTTLVSAQSSDIKFSAGAGTSLLIDTSLQGTYYSGVRSLVTWTSSSFGFDGFFDLSQYFTIRFGYRFSLGQETASAPDNYGNSNSVTYDSTVQQFELGGEVKYPFQFTPQFSLAPKLGLNALVYSSGDVSGEGLSMISVPEGKKFLSPFFLVVGFDFNFTLLKDLFLRIPLDLDHSLNSQLPSDFYAPGTWDSSGDTAIRIGVEIGRTF